MGEGGIEKPERHLWMVPGTNSAYLSCDKIGEKTLAELPYTKPGQYVISNKPVSLPKLFFVP